MNIWVKRAVTLGIVAGVAGGGYAAFGKGTAKKKDEITYETAKVARQDVRSFVTATGIVQAWKTVDVKPNVGGQIDKLFVDLGDTVKAGQLIALINPVDTKAAYDQAQADLTAAEARRQQAILNVRQQELQTNARILAAKQAIASAQARLEQARANSEVQPALTKASISQASASVTSAEKSLAQAKENKKMLDQQLLSLRRVTIPLNIETVENNVEQAKANVFAAEREYNRQKNLLGMGYLSRTEAESAYARMKTARANLLTAQQRLKTLKQENELSVAELQARIAAADRQIEEAAARVLQAEASLELARQNRVQIPVRQKEMEAAMAALKQQEAELQTAEAELKQIKVREQEVLTAQSQIVRSKAAMTTADQNLKFTRVLAPRSGVVIAKNVEEGTVVPSSRASIGSTNAMLQIGDTTRLWVVCSVDETDIGQVSKGQKVTVKVDAYPSLMIDGKVIRIDPQAKIEQNVTMIPVTVEITDPDERFKPGMNAECEFIVDEAPSVLTVPNEAIKESEGVYKVQKMENGVPVEVEVVVGLAGQDVTEIREGLKEDDEVVTKAIVPEKAEANNPFGNPFGRPQRRTTGGAAGGARGGAGGARR